MATKKKTTALATMTHKDLLPAHVEFDDLLENLGEMDEIELPRIRFKKGKFYFSDDPEEEGVEEFEGVILYYGKQKTYYEGTYDPRNITPPTCFSVDAKTGSLPRDNKGRFGSCVDCKYNQWGSGQGRGKACRDQIKLYVHKLGSVIPSTLLIAPTSIGAFASTYIVQKVTQQGYNYARIVTKFKAWQKDEEQFFRVAFEVAATFDGEQDLEKLKELRNYWLSTIKHDRTQLDSSARYDDDEDDDSNSSTRTVEPRKPATVTADDIVDADDDDDPPF